jgi:hypothetical protein
MAYVISWGLLGRLRINPRALSLARCDSPLTNHHHTSEHRRHLMSPSASSEYPKVLTLDTINEHVKNVEYAVRGELSNRATKYSTMLSQGKGKENNLPFESVVSANIGNPQQQPHLAQKPLTFWRQVSKFRRGHAATCTPLLICSRFT